MKDDLWDMARDARSSAKLVFPPDGYPVMMSDGIFNMSFQMG